jgi:hypothetical protein
MKIMMTVMDGAEAERELLSWSSSVINSFTGIAYSRQDFIYLPGR